MIPARLASTRLPGKPLADIAGLPMVVRVAQQAAQSAAHQVVVAADSPDILRACQQHGVRAVLTGDWHASGSDRLAQACELLDLPDDELVVNVQGDEPLIDPALIDQVAALLAQHPQTPVATAAHALQTQAEWLSPDVVKVVLDASGHALYFSRAPIPVVRAGMAHWRSGGPLRHIGLYAYRAGFLRRFPSLTPAPAEVAESLEQLRVLWHGGRIAVHVTQQAPAPGIDTAQDLARVRDYFATR